LHRHGHLRPGAVFNLGWILNGVLTGSIRGRTTVDYTVLAYVHETLGSNQWQKGVRSRACSYTLSLWRYENMVYMSGSGLWPASWSLVLRRNLCVSPLLSTRLSEPKGTALRPSFTAGSGDSDRVRWHRKHVDPFPRHTQTNALADLRTSSG